nr:MAG TPA: hypothetical protein [Bacteriophage sp.]
MKKIDRLKNEKENIYDMQIKEFLNIICYVIDKANEENRQIEE